MKKIRWQNKVDSKDSEEKFKALEFVESAVIEYEGADPVEQTKKSIDNIKALL